MTLQASHLAIEALSAARRWVQSRILLRRILDSKTAPPAQVEKAKVAYNKAGEELEMVVVRLEKLLHQNGIAVSKNRRKPPTKPFPLKELLGVIASGAKAFETALSREKIPAAPIDAHVIDVKGE
jgi:hypothetical protein